MAKKPDETVAIINEVFDALYEDLTNQAPSNVINIPGHRIEIFTKTALEAALVEMRKCYLRQAREGRPIGDWE